MENYCFLSVCGYLDWISKIELVCTAVDMFDEDDTRRNLSTDDYEGIIRTSGDCFCVGTFYGQKFEAEVDTEEGKATLAFLVARPMNGSVSDVVN